MHSSTTQKTSYCYNMLGGLEALCVPSTCNCINVISFINGKDHVGATYMRIIIKTN